MLKLFEIYVLLTLTKIFKAIKVLLCSPILLLAACSMSSISQPTANFTSDSSPLELHFVQPRAPIGPPLPDFPRATTPEVLQELKNYIGKDLVFIVRGLRRREELLPILTQVITDERLPMDILNVAMVESGFIDHARSLAGAVGIWQFMKSTARVYGLKVSFFEDQRKDPILSTLAACRHLRDLYRAYNDWYLALAAYNAGGGGVDRALIRAKSDDFWTISRRKYLRSETARFVPKIIAVTLISEFLLTNGIQGLDERAVELKRLGAKTFVLNKDQGSRKLHGK